MSRLRVGIIGSGGIAQAHAREYYSTNPAEVELVACADLDATRLDHFGKTFGVADAYSNPADLLARSDIDVVDICTPPASHPSVIRAAAEAGKHILCEKPLALDYRDAADAIAVAERAGVKVGVMQNYRFRPEYVDARSIIAGGSLGNPFMATLEALYHWHGGRGYRRHAERMLLLEVGYHYVDLLRYLLGANVVRVYAAAGRPATAIAAGDTYAAIMLHFDSGAIGNIVNSGECHGAAANWGGKTIVQAEEGTVYVNQGKDHPFTLSVYSPSSGGHSQRIYPRELYAFSTNVLFDRPLRAYYQALQAGREFPVTGADNLNTLATVLAAYESAERGCAIDIPSFVERSGARQ